MPGAGEVAIGALTQAAAGVIEATSPAVATVATAATEAAGASISPVVEGASAVTGEIASVSAQRAATAVGTVEDTRGAMAGLQTLANGDWGTPEKPTSAAEREIAARNVNAATTAEGQIDGAPLPTADPEPATAVAAEPTDQRPVEVRIWETEAALLEASLNHLNAVKSGDADAIAKAESEVKEVKAKLDALNAENDAAINAEQADARPLEERLDEARHEMDKLAREILDAESRGDLNARNEAQIKHLLLAAKYKGLFEEGDKDFQKKYLEKVEKEGKKKGKGPLWLRLLKIFGLGTIGALTPVLSDLKDAAEGPPKR